jgi:hypothetical protein
MIHCRNALLEEWLGMSVQKRLRVAADAVLAWDARHLGILTDEAVLRGFHMAFQELVQACAFV